MECPRCASGEMREVTEPTAIRFPGRSVTVSATFLRCGSCGKELWRPDQVEAAHGAAAAQVRRDEDLLMPEEIRLIRESLGLTQQEFERLLRAGKKTVTRWETGEVFQARTADELMRVIRDVPDAAAYLAARRGRLGAPSSYRPRPGATPRRRRDSRTAG